MLTKIFSKLLQSLMPVCCLAAVLLVGCITHARNTAVRMEKAPPQAGDYDTHEFVGVPIIGDHDDDENLDFMIRVDDGDKVFKIYVHKDASPGNRKIIERIRRRINEMEDRSSLCVTGYYTPEYLGEEKEYGFLDLESIVFIDEETGDEEAFFTEPKDSRLKILLLIPFIYLTFILFLS